MVWTIVRRTYDRCGYTNCFINSVVTWSWLASILSCEICIRYTYSCCWLLTYGDWGSLCCWVLKYRDWGSLPIEWLGILCVYYCWGSLILGPVELGFRKEFLGNINCVFLADIGSSLFGREVVINGFGMYITFFFVGFLRGGGVEKMQLAHHLLKTCDLYQYIK